MIATAQTASKNPIMVLGGSGRLLRTAPGELIEVLLESMAVLDGRSREILREKRKPACRKRLTFTGSA